MRTTQQWFDEYAISHQNETNISIHFICVPLIFFSIVGLLMSIDASFLQQTIGLEGKVYVNWFSVILIPILFFYMRLSFSSFLKMLVFSLACYFLNRVLGSYLPLLYTSLVIFVLAWIGQFYGHKIEGKKPSFLKDLQFLLIGPLWVIKKVFG